MASWSRPSDGVLAVPGRDPASRSGYRSETVRRALLASSQSLSIFLCMGVRGRG